MTKRSSFSRTVLIGLTVTCGVVMVAHVFSVLGRILWWREPGPVKDLLAMLDAGSERTLAAWWTATMLAAAALIAVGVAALARRTGHSPRVARAWQVMAVVFALMSLDETVSIHERGATLTAQFLDPTTTWGRLGWTIPAAAVLALGAIILVPAFRALPRRTRVLILTGLGVAISGALGMELVHVALAHADARLRWRHISIALEELAEMGGVVIVIAGTLSAIAGQVEHGRLTLTYRSGPEPAAPSTNTVNRTAQTQRTA